MKPNEMREQLMAQESLSSEREHCYREELRKMVNRELNLPKRIAFMLSGALCLALGIFFLVVAWKSWGDLPLLASGTFLLGFLFSLGWGVMVIRILRRGAVDIKSDGNATAGLLWVFNVLMMTAFLMLGSQMEDTAKGNQMILTGLVFLVTFGVVFMLTNHIQQAELRTREQLLRLEQAILELREDTSAR